MAKFAAAHLASLADLHNERYGYYGPNYLSHGEVMQALFPNGLKLLGQKDQARLGLFTQIVSKLTRYAANFTKGGHEDSLDDLAVYAILLQEVDKDATFDDCFYEKNDPGFEKAVENFFGATVDEVVEALSRVRAERAPEPFPCPEVGQDPLPRVPRHVAVQEAPGGARTDFGPKGGI